MNIFLSIKHKFFRLLGKPLVTDIYVDLAVAAEETADIKTLLNEVYDMQDNGISKQLITGLTRRYDKDQDLEASLAWTFGGINQALFHAMRTENNGLKLSDVFDFQSELLTRRELIKNTTKRVLIYPATVSIVALMVIAILLIFVVPQFAELFASFGAQLPALTQMVVNLSAWFVEFWWIFAIFLCLPIMYKFKRFRPAFDKILTSLPILSVLYNNVSLLQFMETLVSFKAKQMLPYYIIKYAAYSISNHRLREAVQNELNSFTENDGMIKILSSLSIMPKRLKRRLAVNNSADKAVADIDEIIQDESYRIAGKMDSLTTVVGTISSALIAVLIGTFVIGMYLPIFYVAQVVT